MRLTQRMNDGCDTICENCPMKGKCSDTQDCVNVLAERLAAYEDAEEQGLLVRLPCKVDKEKMEQILQLCSNNS